ncbi:MAG: hypothetical protein ABGZ24_22325, partial [Fuerstiella sp.]
MNMPANATDLISTGQTKGRHYIAFWISNTGVIKFSRRKHGQKISTPSTLSLFWGTWVRLDHARDQFSGNVVVALMGKRLSQAERRSPRPNI